MSLQPGDGPPVFETWASLFGIHKVMIKSILVPCVRQIQEERGDYGERATNAIMVTPMGTLGFLKAG